MIAIPVDTNDVITIVNLPADMSTNPIWSEHAPLVMRRLASLCTEIDYLAATSNLPTDDPLPPCFRIAFAFLLLSSVAEFLNLKTVGEGIVKTIGLDSSATELLTGNEIEAFKLKLEFRALSELKSYLNPTGLARLAELNPTPKKSFRIALI